MHRQLALIPWLVGLVLVLAEARLQALFGRTISRQDNDVLAAALRGPWEPPVMAVQSNAILAVSTSVAGACLLLVLQEERCSKRPRIRGVLRMLELPILVLSLVGLALWVETVWVGFKLSGEDLSEGMLPVYAYPWFYAGVWVNRTGSWLKRSQATSKASVPPREE